jgi:hypothetical protein
MSGAVVRIQGGDKCGRRKNRPEDQWVISSRRSIDKLNPESAEDLALLSALERKLPCGNLRLIAGTLDARKDFELRLIEVDIARGERDAYEAKWRRAYVLNGEDAAAADKAYPECERHFERLRRAISDLARTPAVTLLDLKSKRRAIGPAWLKAEGRWYDDLRASIATDEKRIHG